MPNKRIVRRRTRGWRLPPNAQVVDRTSRWGNPFRVGVDGDAAECVAQFRADLEDWRERDPQGFAAWLAPLRQKDLACFCRLDQVCHADVLIECIQQLWPEEVTP